MTSRLLTLHGQVASRAELVTFIEALREDLSANPADWENPDLSSFLGAMSAWVADMDGYYQNTGQPPPAAPSWKMIADILLASKIYE